MMSTRGVKSELGKVHLSYDDTDTKWSIIFRSNSSVLFVGFTVELIDRLADYLIYAQDELVLLDTLGK